MGAIVNRKTIVKAVSIETCWMVSQRMGKLEDALHDTMSVNPFLMPILYDLHHAERFSDLGELLIAGHLMSGHNTSFGKLIDEKVLPNLFKTDKLTANHRQEHAPLQKACFDNIDHIVPRPNAKPALLSLKTSRWTINLGGAKDLNTAFASIIKDYGNLYDQIVVGVIIGKGEELGDKYDILRGINRGKNHEVIDISAAVSVLAGRQFWAWINGGEVSTQDWVIDGILEGLRIAKCRKDCKELLEKYISAFNARYAKHVKKDGSIDWHRLLSELNG